MEAFDCVTSWARVYGRGHIHTRVRRSTHNGAYLACSGCLWSTGSTENGWNTMAFIHCSGCLFLPWANFGHASLMHAVLRRRLP